MRRPVAVFPWRRPVGFPSEAAVGLCGEVSGTDREEGR